MKVKEGRKLLESYSGEDLYRQGCKLFRSEVNSLIALRSHGKKPTEGVIVSAINQVKYWFYKVAAGFPWPGVGTPKDIINWETGNIWAEYGIINPEIVKYRNRVRREIIKGTTLPLLETLTPKALEAMSSMFISQLQVGTKLYLKREEFVKKTGKRLCPYGEKERFCKHQGNIFNGRVYTITY